MPFRTIKDSDVRSIWKCEESECDAEIKEAVIEPTFYQDSGTPVCECGDDMVYSHTEVRGQYEALKTELKRYKTLVELKGLDISVVDVLFSDFEPAMCIPLKDVYGSLYSRVLSIAAERDCEYLGDLAILYHYGKTVHGLGVLNLDTGYYSIKNILASHGISLPLTHDVFVKWLKIRPRGLDGYPIKKENTND